MFHQLSSEKNLLRLTFLFPLDLASVDFLKRHTGGFPDFGVPLEWIPVDFRRPGCRSKAQVKLYEVLVESWTTNKC